MENSKLFTLCGSFKGIHQDTINGSEITTAIKYGYDGHRLDNFKLILNPKTGREAQYLIDNFDEIRLCLEIHKRCLETLDEVKTEFMEKSKVIKGGSDDELQRMRNAAHGVSPKLTTLSDSEVSNLRLQALKMSRDLHPNTMVQNQAMLYGGTLSTPPAISVVLADADKIYEWLIKEV